MSEISEAIEKAKEARSTRRGLQPQDRAGDRDPGAVPGVLGDAGQGRADRGDQPQIEASDLWAFFQAKTIRRTTLNTAADETDLLGRRPERSGRQGRDRTSRSKPGSKTAERYEFRPESRRRPQGAGERAKEAEAERDLSLAQYHHYELASAAFQIGIVLARRR